MSALICKDDNRVNIWQLLHNTPASVVAYMQMVLASSFNAINSVISLRSVFNNCGGKCVSLTISSLAGLMTTADHSMQACKVKDDACLDPIHAKATKSIQDFESKVFVCLTGASIVITKENWKKVVDSFKDGIRNAIKQDVADFARALSAASAAGSQVKVVKVNTGTSVARPNAATLPKPQPPRSVPVPVPIAPRTVAIQPVSNVPKPVHTHG